MTTLWRFSAIVLPSTHTHTSSFVFVVVNKWISRCDVIADDHGSWWTWYDSGIPFAHSCPEWLKWVRCVCAMAKFTKNGKHFFGWAELSNECTICDTMISAKKKKRKRWRRRPWPWHAEGKCVCSMRTYYISSHFDSWSTSFISRRNDKLQLGQQQTLAITATASTTTTTTKACFCSCSNSTDSHQRQWLWQMHTAHIHTICTRTMPPPLIHGECRRRKNCVCEVTLKKRWETQQGSFEMRTPPVLH